jgi:hypothetical protein
MKTILKLFVPLCLLLTCCLSLAQDVSLGANYAIGDKDVKVVTAVPFDTLWDGKNGWKFELVSLAGASSTEMMYGGGSFFTYEFNPRLKFGIGPTISKKGVNPSDLFSDFKFQVGASMSVWYSFPTGPEPPSAMAKKLTVLSSLRS